MSSISEKAFLCKKKNFANPESSNIYTLGQNRITIEREEKKVVLKELR